MKRILLVSSDEKLKESIFPHLEKWGYHTIFESFTEPDQKKIIKISPDIIVVDVEAGEEKRFEICRLLKHDFITAHIPVITIIAHSDILKKLLDLKHGIDDYLLKPVDVLDLRVRIEMAAKRSKYCFYASPLTGLPGGKLIEEVLKERIDEKKPFVVGHADIDNFKSFNDVFGYLQGDRVIMQTAHMLSTAVRGCGEKSDFIGHIGGDDFVFITSPERYQQICRSFICMFDTVIPFYYSKEERMRGFIKAEDRARKMKKHPLMSVTVALVIQNELCEYKNIIEINESIAEVKKYLKTMPGSKYMADRRAVTDDEALKLQRFQVEEEMFDYYQPIGQILLKKKMITTHQLDEALKIHWKKGITVGEALKELGYLTKEQLEEALKDQETNVKAE